jgi:hypothetical protein
MTATKRLVSKKILDLKILLYRLESAKKEMSNRDN